MSERVDYEQCRLDCPIINKCSGLRIVNSDAAQLGRVSFDQTHFDSILASCAENNCQELATLRRAVRAANKLNK